MKPNLYKLQDKKPKQSITNQSSLSRQQFEEKNLSQAYSMISLTHDKQSIGQIKVQRTIQIINHLVSEAINEIKKQEFDSQASMGSSQNNQKNQQTAANNNSNTGYSNNSSSANTSLNNAHLSNRISLNLEQSRTQQILRQLRKGYLIKKHSPGTSQPHDKYVYISEDARFFCWKSIDKDDQKSIELRKITNIVKGPEYADSKTMKALKNTPRAKNCLVVISEVRNLEIQTFSYDVVETLHQGFQEMMKNSKRMYLSYRF